MNNIAHSLFNRLVHSTIPRRAGVLLAALALCGLASCSKENPAPPGGNAGGQQKTETVQSTALSPEMSDAVSTGDLEKVRTLLKADPGQIAAKNSNGGSILHQAVVNGSKELVELLLANKADVNARNNNGGTPLHRAATAGNKDAAEVLITKGANVNAQNNDGATPLRQAIASGHPEVAELIRQHGGKE